MNPIITAVSLPAIRGQDAGHTVPLAARVLAQGDDLPVPGPIPDPMPDLVRNWARQMFTELMMTGDEEETGITPLSIDI